MDNEVLKLKKEIERLKRSVKTQRYGLNWFDVPEAFEDDVENKIPVLKEEKKLALTSKDSKPTHLLIEGDNYHALTCLNYTHKEKVDFIYIDPPYNTGSDGFKYKDKRVLEKYPDGSDVPKDHPLRHSYWLSFMRKRLELAKDLLKEDGKIFISIDDNESAQLKMLCDEIFGVSNFLIPLYIQVRYPGKTLVEDMEFQKLIETVYVYGKSAKAKLNRETIDYSFDKFIWKINTTGKPKKLDLGGKTVELFKQGQYEIVEDKPSRNNLKEIWATGKVLDGNSSGRFFRDYLEKRRDQDGLNSLYKVYGIGDDQFDFRYFTGPKRAKATKGKYYQGVPQEVLDAKEKNVKFRPINNFYDFADSFGNCRLEGGIDFRSGKKPLAFLRFLLNLGIVREESNIILDFFAGSGTTGHAVLELNQARNSSHQFILVTNNDEVTNGVKNKIMTDICYPRIKNAIKGYGKNPGLGSSVKYYKTFFIGRSNVLDASDEDKVDLALNAGELLAIAENTLEFIDANDHFQIFSNRDETNYTAIYFREELDLFEEFEKRVNAIAERTVVYLFSWGNEVFDNDFSLNKRVQVKAIPMPILEIYQNIYNLVSEI